MAPMTNAQRQAAYRERLKEAARIEPTELAALRQQSVELRRMMPQLKAMLAELPDGKKKEKLARDLEALKAAMAAHAKVTKQICDKPKAE